MKSNEERSLAHWLARHHGVVTRRDAQRLGVTDRELTNLVERGRLERRHPGVYVELPPRVAPALAASAAALAAAGEGSALSHRSAAWQWGLLPAAPARVELLVPFGARSHLGGVIVHRSRAAFWPRSKDGLRLTDPVRTVVDIAATSPRLLTDVVDRALADRLLRLSDLEVAAKPTRNRRVRGAPALFRHLVARGYLGAPAPSVLESKMARLLQCSGLTLPQAEYVAGENGEYRLDFAYPAIKLAIEVDGYVWHSSPEQARADNARRNRLLAQGWRVLVYTWASVRDTPDEVVAEILAAYLSLAAAG